MNLGEIRNILNAKVLTDQTEQQLTSTEILMVCGSDLMSDVLAFVKDQGMLMTGLINPQVVRTAEMMDIHVVCFVRGKMPDETVVSLAKELGVVLLSTEYPMYVACGKLYKDGLNDEGD